MNWQSEDVDDQLVGRLMELQSRLVTNCNCCVGVKLPER